jgi:hypothetical protein
MPTHEVSILNYAKSSNSTDTATTATTTTTGRIMNGTLRRKLVKRSLPLKPTAAEPLASPMPIDEDKRVAKKPRLEVPLLSSPTTEKAAQSTKIASPVAEEAVLPPADAYRMTPTPRAAGAPSSESTLESKVELMIHAEKQHKEEAQ